MGCNRTFVSILSEFQLSSNIVASRPARLTFFVRPLPVLPVVLLLSRCHEGSGGHYDMCVRIPRRLTPKEGGVVSGETPAHMGLRLHAVEVHDWEKKSSAREKLIELIGHI